MLPENALSPVIYDANIKLCVYLSYMFITPCEITIAYANTYSFGGGVYTIVYPEASNRLHNFLSIVREVFLISHAI